MRGRMGEVKSIGVRERHSPSTPVADSPSSNTPVQVSFQEITHNQHKKFWIGGKVLRTGRRASNLTVQADSC